MGGIQLVGESTLILFVSWRININSFCLNRVYTDYAYYECFGKTKKIISKNSLINIETKLKVRNTK